MAARYQNHGRRRAPSFAGHGRARLWWLPWLALAAGGGCDSSPQPAPPTASQNGSADGRATPADAASSAADSNSHFRFVDVAKQANVDWTYRNGEEANESTILESLGGGAGWLDYDKDGRLDLYLPGGGLLTGQQVQGLPSMLYRQVHPWRFEPVADAAGVALAGHYSHGVAIGDYDNDGFADVLETGFGGLRLWRNLGDGCFEDLTESAGLTDAMWSSSAGWGDVNRDGWLDLYVAHYVDWSFDNHPYCSGPSAGQRDVCSPRKFEPLPDVLYLNEQDGGFVEAGPAWKLSSQGKGLGVVLSDIDNDHDLDIYVGNDTTDNFLYYNEGDHLQENAALMGAAVNDGGVANGSMGVDVFDYNRDGRTDIWVANFERESFALYRNEGDAGFLHASLPLGITALGGLFVGFGSAAADWDLDGDEDVVVINGHVIKYSGKSPRRQTPVLLENDQGERFRKAGFAADQYFARPIEGRGLATADVDGDGDLDMAVSLMNEPAALLRNDTPHSGDWLQVQLVGRRSPRDAVGARLELRVSNEAGDVVMLRHIKGGGSYLSQSDLVACWGVAKADKVKELIIWWPAGSVQRLTWADPPRNRRLVIHEAASDGE